MEIFLQHKIKVWLLTPLNEQKRLKVLLNQVEEETITIETQEGNTIVVPFAHIDKARLYDLWIILKRIVKKLTIRVDK